MTLVIQSFELFELMQREDRALDAPNIKDDYYVNLMDWGKNNVLAVALDSAVYLWNAENKGVNKLFQIQGDNDNPASVAWSENTATLAVGYSQSMLQIWDPETSKCVSTLNVLKIGKLFHFSRVDSLYSATHRLEA